MTMHYAFEITKCFSFEAAHDLPQMPPEHKCHRGHGHSYEVWVSVADMELDADGFVLDFGELGALCKTYIDRYLDHRNLSEVLGDGKYTTAERLAVILFYIWKPKLPLLVQVAVKETAKTIAKFRPEVEVNQSIHQRDYWLTKAGIELKDFQGIPTP